MRKTFGIKRLRPGQTEVIANVLSGRNLRYDVAHVTNDDEKLAQCLAHVREVTGSVIIYAATVKAVDELYASFEMRAKASAATMVACRVRSASHSRTRA